jgi:predicted DNA-binding protein
MRAKTESPVVGERRTVAPRAVERIVLTLPHGLVERLTEVAEKKGLTRAAYIRMVLTDHLATESIEEVDRQLWELAKRAEKGRPDRR